MEQVYSRDGERYEDLSTIMDYLRDDEDLNIGDSVELDEGTAIKAKHSDFFTGFSLIESFQEQAYDEHGEWAECYLDDLNSEQACELEVMLAAWLDKNTDAPTFWKVLDVKKTTVVVD